MLFVSVLFIKIVEYLFQLTLSSTCHSSLKFFEHRLITSSREQPVLCRFGPEAVRCRFFLCILNNPSFYTGVFDVDSREAPHCWRPLDPLLMISSQTGYCFHVLHNSCIFLASYQLYIVFFCSTMDHLFLFLAKLGWCVLLWLRHWAKQPLNPRVHRWCFHKTALCCSGALHSGLIVLFPGQYDQKTCGKTRFNLYMMMTCNI